MSSYIQNTKHPDTGEFEPAYWLDDHFGNRHYGVKFKDGKIFDPEKIDLETNDDDPHTTWDDYPPAPGSLKSNPSSEKTGNPGKIQSTNTEVSRKLEEVIGKYFGWVKCDQPPFAGMWVGDDGESSYDITDLVVAIQAYHSQIEDKLVSHERADYNRLKKLEIQGIGDYRTMREAPALTPEAVVSFIHQLSTWNLKISGLGILEAYHSQALQRIEVKLPEKPRYPYNVDPDDKSEWLGTAETLLEVLPDIKKTWFNTGYNKAMSEVKAIIKEEMT